MCATNLEDQLKAAIQRVSHTLHRVANPLYGCALMFLPARPSQPLGFRTSHTVEYDPLINRQLASSN